MTVFHFIAPTLFALRATVWLGGGALIGAAYFLTLHWNVRLLTFGRAPVVAAAVQVSRFVVLAGLLTAIADRCGALPLLFAAAGVVTTRTMMTMRLGVPT